MVYVSAYGVQREEQIYSGSTTDRTWDIKWFSEVKQTDNAWVIAIAIPLSYIRFSKSLNSLGANFIRNDISHNEISSWSPTPRNFTLPNLSHEGNLLWDQVPKVSARKIHLLPALTYNASQVKREKIKNKLKPSLDAKVSLSTSLNLDLTINSDFSQAEVDDAQVNLTRFELSYPEKRFFFVENSDLFSEFGISKVGTTTLHPFYSRRIGLRYNTETSQFEQTPVVAGARLHGKINNDLRIGLMSVQTAALNNDGAIRANYFPSQNYSVLAFRQKIFHSSNIGLIFTNQQAFGTDSTRNFKLNNKDFDRLAGVEYNLISRNGK